MRTPPWSRPSTRSFAPRAQPGFRYATFRLDDGVSFVHVAVVDDDSRPLTRLAAFKRFQKGLHERCVEGPEVTPASVVGSYGFVDP